LIIVSYWVGQHCDKATEKYIIIGKFETKNREIGNTLCKLWIPSV